MPIRRARPDDLSLVLPLLRDGFPAQDWTENMVEERLRLAGIHLVDPDSLGYVHLTINDLADPFGPVPAGLTTHIASLLPQHHDQTWVDDVMFPLLADALLIRQQENAPMMIRPLYGLLPTTLLPFWEGKLGSIAFGNHLIYVLTLHEAISKIHLG